MIHSQDVRPAARRAFRISITLGGVSVTLHLRWLPRLSAWTCQLQTPDEVDLSQWLVVQGGAEVPFDTTLDGSPSGRLYWVGPETYQRTDIGTIIQLLWDDGE